MKKKMSGSVDLEKDQVEYEKDELEKESLELLKKIFDSDVFNSVVEKEITKTQYILKPPADGSKHHWFFNLDTKQLQQFHKDILVEVIADQGEDMYICYANGCNYIIPKKMIKEMLVN